MTASTNIIKHQGKRPSEPFEQRKLYASIVAACLSVRSHEGEAETAAAHVLTGVTEWLANKPEVTSDDLRRKAAEILERYHPDAAYAYKHYRSVI